MPSHCHSHTTAAGWEVDTVHGQVGATGVSASSRKHTLDNLFLRGSFGWFVGVDGTGYETSFDESFIRRLCDIETAIANVRFNWWIGFRHNTGTVRYQNETVESFPVVRLELCNTIARRGQDKDGSRIVSVAGTGCITPDALPGISRTALAIRVTVIGFVDILVALRQENNLWTEGQS